MDPEHWVSQHCDQETLTAVLGEELMPGSATVLYTFTGVLNDKLCGFYRSKYTVNGEDRCGP
jgi:puromycin-sensitive aminopeptidase